MSGNTAAREKGAKFEQWVADYLADVLDSDFIVRSRTHGSKDRGDIAGVRYGDERVVIECKSVKDVRLWDFLQEADVEAANDGAAFGVVVLKVPGYGRQRMGRQLAAMRSGVFRERFGDVEGAELNAGTFMPSLLEEYASYPDELVNVSKRGEPSERAVLMSLTRFAGELAGGTCLLDC